MNWQWPLPVPACRRWVPVGGVQRENISRSISGECETLICGAHAGTCDHLADVMGPTNFPGLIVDGFDHGRRPEAIVPPPAQP